MDKRIYWQWSSHQHKIDDRKGLYNPALDEISVANIGSFMKNGKCTGIIPKIHKLFCYSDFTWNQVSIAKIVINMYYKNRKKIVDFCFLYQNWKRKCFNKINQFLIRFGHCKHRWARVVHPCMTSKNCPTPGAKKTGGGAPRRKKILTPRWGHFLGFLGKITPRSTK